MHPGRRNILIRWIGYAVVIIATAGWIYMDEPQMPRAKTDILKALAPKTIDLPSDQVTEAIRAAIQVSEKKVATYGAVEKVNPSLIVLDVASIDRQQVMLDVSTIFLGPPDKYAVLGGKIYKEGESLPDGRKVQGIDAEGVNLALGDAVTRLAWVPPFRVELTGGAKYKARVKPEEGQDQGGQGGQEGDQGVNLQDLPPDLSPDQALELLQQLGKK
ncbi:MAG: hypothetical protein KKE73_04825 [Proteobacteria bacterium]|nr:hypothetical protein [Pseudomonadota bacterium]